MDRIDGCGPQKSGRIGRIAEQARSALAKSRGGVSAGASGLVDTTRTVADRAGRGIGRAAEIVRESEPDEELGQAVSGATEETVHLAGTAVDRMAPAIGRGAEFVVDKAGAALHRTAEPLGRAMGAVAGRIGGWWNMALEKDRGIPSSESEICREHLEMLTVVSEDGDERDYV